MTADWLVGHEPAVRATAFVAMLGVLGVAERVRPCRGDARPAPRQLVNLAMVVLDTVLLRLVLPVVGIGVALWAEAAGVGLFAVTTWPPLLEAMLAILALDATIYWQHRVLHLVPLLWRAHRVHHSDLAFDVTLGVRFHPFEIVLSQALKLAVIAALGAPPLAVLLFEVWLQAGALFTHTDVALSPRADGLVRWLIVTPSMHRVHHSIAPDETDSNFGFNLTWWDRLFGTYRAMPRQPETAMPIGVAAFRAPHEQGLLALLWQPLRDAAPAVPGLATEQRRA